jgi:hypothetical protein
MRADLCGQHYRALGLILKILDFWHRWREASQTVRRAWTVSRSLPGWRQVVAVEVPVRRQGKTAVAGVYPDVSLKDARERRDAARKTAGRYGMEPHPVDHLRGLDRASDLYGHHGVGQFFRKLHADFI